MICSGDWRETQKLLPSIWLRYSRERRESRSSQELYISKDRYGFPAIYENGTLFVTNQKLTLQTLKEISDLEDVLEIAGDYTGNITARGPSLPITEFILFIVENATSLVLLISTL
jgi:hypothetical protein